MDSSKKNSPQKASAVHALPAATSDAAPASVPASPAARRVPMRMLATAGILLGFATGLTINFLSQPQGRAFVAKAQMAMTHGPSSVKQDVAYAGPAPVMVAED